MVECGEFMIQVAMSDDRLNEIEEGGPSGASKRASGASNDDAFGGTKVRPFESISGGWSDK